MRINVSVFCIAFLLWQTCNAETKKSWSWGNTKNDEKPKEEIMPSDDADLKDTNPRSFTSYDFVPDESEQLVYVKPEQTYNETVMSDQIVDAILTSTRQGRNLQEYDQVYSDPDIQDALQKGNDVEARQLIKERLCNLGLMKCDEVSPDEVIYAQPVAIKPVGEPIASIPVRGPPRAIYHPSKPYRPSGPYGSSKPLASVPPRRGYGPTPQIKPPYLSGSAAFIGASSNLYDGPGPSFSGKPYPNVEFERPYKFEQIPTKIQITPNGSPSTIAPSLTNGAQQHVHHHFHHAGDSSGQLPTIVVNNPVPVSTPATPIFKPTPASVNLLTSGHLSGVQGSLSSLFSSNTKPVIEHSGPQTFGSSSGAPLYSGHSQNGFYGSGGSSYGSNFGSFGSSQPFYKKELNINSGIYNGNAIQPGLGTYANGYQEFDSNRVENYDCVCVPIQQCPSQDIIGRKEDLYLNIDPRHLNSDIQAEDDNSTIINGTSIRITKEISQDDKIDAKEDKKQITKRDVSETLTEEDTTKSNVEPRQAYYQRPNQCGPRHVCCRRPSRPIAPLPSGNGRNKQCGSRHAKGINGRIKTPAYIDGDSEFGEYPWQVAILKKDSQESVYVCGGTLIDDLHVLTAAHCVKMYSGFDLRVRLGEWDVNHDVEFYPYIERDVISVHVHPEFYAGTLYNDIAVLKLEKPVDWTRSPHISPACLPDRFADYTGHRCWTTGWGKDAFGDFGKYQNILKEVDVPIIGHQQCQQQLQNTRLGYDFKLHPGFICAGGEEGKDACKGDGGGPMVCERSGIWQIVGIVSWGIGCGQYGVPGVYVKVANYLDWIKQITQNY